MTLSNIGLKWLVVILVVDMISNLTQICPCPARISAPVEVPCPVMGLDLWEIGGRRNGSRNGFQEQNWPSNA